MFLLILVCTLICRQVVSVRVQDDSFDMNNESDSEGNFFGENDFFSCVTKQCIRKCCQQNEIYKGAVCVKSDSQKEMRVYLENSGLVEENTYTFHADLKCDATKNFYKIKLEDFMLLQNGSVFIEEFNYTFSVENNCLETDDRSEGAVVIVVICGLNDESLNLTLKVAGVSIAKFSHFFYHLLFYSVTRFAILNLIVYLM